MPRTARVSSATPNVSNRVVWRSHSAGLAKKRPVCSGRPTLLWVDDFQPGLELYRAMFEGMGFKVLTATCGTQAVKLAAQHLIDVVVTRPHNLRKSCKRNESYEQAGNRRIKELQPDGSVFQARPQPANRFREYNGCEAA